MRAIWRHQRRVAKQLSARQSTFVRPCPTCLPIPWSKSSSRSSSRLLTTSVRHYDALEPNSAAVDTVRIDELAAIRAQTARLPLSCPGCGAPSQTIAAEEAGYYNLTRSGVRNYVREEVRDEDKVMSDILSNVDKSTLSSLGLADGVKATKTEQQQRQTPICDRCHNLLHHSASSSTPILHPSIESIQQMIEESPHKNNHIYHIIDAADFPLSLIPNLTNSLLLPRLRTQNRRSKTKFSKGRVAEVSFIITRSDLLAPQKEQVDGLMPYLRETLRNALGKSGEKIRLGNVRCVSSKRGWWTKQVKEDVWDRGGGGWMVGKVNVGKSGFFEAVFPKGRGGDDKVPNLNNLRQEEQRRLALESGKEELDLDEENAAVSHEEEDKVASLGEALADLPGDMDDMTSITETTQLSETPTSPETRLEAESIASEEGLRLPAEVSASAVTTEDAFSSTNLSAKHELIQDEDDDLDLFDASLLPPAQKEMQYPHMPTISSLPGTTASPIRIPFGSGKGELIDLPGIARSHLDEHVRPEHQQDLVMRNRVTPEQHTIKPSQSLLLGGGLIRITPKTEGEVMLAYPFLPLLPHVTATAKAEAIETGERESGIKSIVAEGVFGSPASLDLGEDARQGKMKSAGTFKLRWDVTKKRSGPLTSASAAKLRPEVLPFRVYAADVLIEGVGWVELVCQVRKKRRVTSADSTATEAPEVTSLETLPKLKEDEELASFTPVSSTSVGGPEPNDMGQETTPTTVESPEHSEAALDSTVYKPLSQPDIKGEDTPPEVEIFTPEGKFVGIRPPMNAYLLGGRKADLAGRGKGKGRPRASMKSLKGSREGRSGDY